MMFSKKYDSSKMKAYFIKLNIRISNLSKDLKSRLRRELTDIIELLKSKEYSNAKTKSTNYVLLQHQLSVLSVLSVYCDNLMKGALLSPIKLDVASDIDKMSLATIIYCRRFFTFPDMGVIESQLKRKYKKNIVSDMYSESFVEKTIKYKLSGQINDKYVFQFINHICKKYKIEWNQQDYEAYVHYENMYIDDMLNIEEETEKKTISKKSKKNKKEIVEDFDDLLNNL